MRVSINGGTPKSSTLMGFSLINHPFWGTPIYGNPQMSSQMEFAKWSYDSQTEPRCCEFHQVVHGDFRYSLILQRLLQVYGLLCHHMLDHYQGQVSSMEVYLELLKFL